MKHAVLWLGLLPTLCLAQTQLWSEIYPDAQLQSLTRCPDGNFLAAGTVEDTMYGYIGFQWKVDPEGITVWDQGYYPGTFLYDVICDGDGNVFAVGSSYTPFIFKWKGWTLKADNSGTMLWQHFPGDPDIAFHYMLNGVCQGQDGHFVAGGIGEYDDTLGIGQAWILKFDDSGDTLWNRCYNLGYYAEITSVIAHPDSGYIASAVVRHLPDTTYSFALIRLSESGDTLWTKLYNFPQHTYITDIKVDPSGGYVGVGSITYQTEPDVSQGWLAHFDEAGDTLDFLVFPTAETANLNSIAYCPPDRWVLAGSQTVQTDMQAWLLYCDYDGDVLWSQTYGDALTDWASDVAVDDSGCVYCAGCKNYTGYGADAWIFKVDPQPVGIEPHQEPHPPESLSLCVHPNPFNARTIIRYQIPAPANVQLSVYNTCGRRMATLFEGIRLPGSYQAILHADDWPSGVYLLRLQSTGRVQIRKILLLK